MNSSTDEGVVAEIGTEIGAGIGADDTRVVASARAVDGVAAPVHKRANSALAPSPTLNAPMVLAGW